MPVLHTAHPFLVVMQACLARTAPLGSWRRDEVIALGVATPLEGQWLIARNTGGIVETWLSADPPLEPRAAMVLDSDSADAALGNGEGGEVRVLGDRDFLSRTLSDCLAIDSAIGIRVKINDLSNGRTDT